MATQADMRNRIKRDLAIDGTEYDQQIDDALRSAIREHEQDRFWFLEDVDTISPTEGSPNWSLPSNFGSLLEARILVNGYWRGDGSGFNKVGIKELQDSSSPLKSGIPSQYAIWNGSDGGFMYFDVSLNADYTIQLRYYKKDTSLPEGDTDTSVWYGDGQDVIRTLAMAMFKDEALEYEATQKDWARYERYLSALRTRNTYYGKGSLN